MIASPQHLTNQQSDAPTGSWMQVERWPPNGSTSQEQEKEKKRSKQDETRASLEGGYVVGKKKKNFVA